MTYTIDFWLLEMQPILLVLIVAMYVYGLTQLIASRVGKEMVRRARARREQRRRLAARQAEHAQMIQIRRPSPRPRREAA